jgi:diacylglycerol kinase family enzyme
METRLTDLGLQGHVGRLGPLKNAKDMVREALQAGARTIVAVGIDKTFAEVADALAGLDVVMGLIPITETRIGKFFGVASAQNGCKILAARKIETIDLARINTQYFLTDAIIESTSPIKIQCDANYKINVTKTPVKISIANMTDESHCQDGLLNCFIDTTEQGWFKTKTRRTNVSAQKINISSGKEVCAIVDGNAKIKLPIDCEVVPNALRIIVGKDRIF